MTLLATQPMPRKGNGRRMMDVSNPVTGEVVAQVPHSTPQDMIAAIERARAAQPGWATLSFKQRARVFIRFHDLILKRREELFDVIQSESGKSRRDAFVELFAVACETRYYAYNGWKHIRPRRIKSAIAFKDRSRVAYRPVGVVGVISPWNFPFILSIGDAIAALLAGNTVVIKPASLTPLTALWARDRLVECGLPEDACLVITGPGRELGDAMIDHVDYLMFTGSTEIGRRLAERAARRLIHYSMELGGKNPMLILPDANLRHAAEVAVEGSFNNSGQVCINFERIYIHQSIYEPFKAELLRQTAAVRLGKGNDFSYDLGSLASEEQLKTVERHIKDALVKGARLLAGGKRRPDIGPLYYEPTILENATPRMSLYSEETFGPVIALYPIGSVEEGIRRANDSPFGLHSCVYAGDRRQGERVAAQMQTGTVCVNDGYMNWGAVDGPLGGFKESGVGRRHGPEGIRRFTEAQTITTNLTRFQVSSYETPLAINDKLASMLTLLLRLWRYVPFIR